MRAREKKKKEATPDMFSLLDARDYTGAITLIEFERKMFLDKKHGACGSTNSANARAPFPCDKPWAVERRVSLWPNIYAFASPLPSPSQLAAGALAGAASTSG